MTSNFKPPFGDKQANKRELDVERYLTEVAQSVRLDELEKLAKELDKRQTRQAWYGFGLYLAMSCLFLLFLTM